MESNERQGSIEQKYAIALKQFVEKIKRDEQVIAVILLGSLSYDQVWEKSDIDISIIVNEQKLVRKHMCFVENDVLFNAGINTRNDFKRWVEKSLQSSIDHSFLVRGTLLFTRDQTIEEYFENIRYIGDRDRELQLMRLGGAALSTLAKAEKWYRVKKDVTYSLFWVLKMVDTLASIEVVLNNEVPMREAVKQALQFNPGFFSMIYTDLVNEKAGPEKLEQVLGGINEYLDERAEKLFRPILQYLQTEKDVRSVTEMADKLGKVANIGAGTLAETCEWLAEKGLVDKVETAARVTPKSRVQLEEPAFIYSELGMSDDFEDNQI